MRDQSHKEEMSSVLQADFARLRARGIATTLAPASAQELAAESHDEPSVAPRAPALDAGPVPADSWLKRLLRAP